MPVSRQTTRPYPVPAITRKGLAALTRVFAQTSRDLQRAAPSDSDRAIHAALASVGAALGADRAYVFETLDTVFIRNTHEWCADDIAAMRDTLQHVPFESGALFWERFRERGSLQIGDVSALIQGSELRQVLEDQDITALIAAPFWRNGEIIGFVGLDFTKGPRIFTAAEDNMMRGFAAQVGMLRALALSEGQQRRQETELARVRAQLSAAVAALPELLVETDHDGVIVGFHQSTPLTFAAAPQEVIGQPPERVLPPHLASIVRKAMREVDLFGWSQSHSYWVDTPAGRKWYSLYATTRDLKAPGKGHGYLFVVRDVTDAQLQNRRVRQLVQIAEQASNLIMLTDAERRIRWMNPAALSRTGYSQAQAEGLRPSEVLHLGQASPDLVTELCQTLDSGHSIAREVRAQTRDGAEYWLDLNVQPLRDAEGEIEGYMVIASDTTSHKQAEARLLHERSHVMSASHEGMAIIRPNGRMSYMNNSLRSYLNVPEDTRVETLLWTDLTPPDLAEQMTSILPILLSTGTWEGEFTRPAQEGGLNHFAITLSVQDDTSTLAIVRNVTERKKAEQEQARLRERLQRAQSQQLGAQLAAGMAHDFANVLATISASVETLAGQVRDDAKETIDRIRAATREARALARGLTRLESARPSAITQPLEPILRAAADLLHPSLDGAIRLELDFADSGLFVHGDRMEVMQVVLNLLLNARDACRQRLDHDASAPAVLSVRARPCAPVNWPVAPDIGALLAGVEYVTIDVADTGDGIDPALRGAIFTPYLSTKGDAGAGLGLTVVADIVQSRGAALQVVSNATGGTRMRVFWPCHSLETSEAAKSDTPLADTNILLVDNDDALLQTMSGLLVRAGAEVASCADPEDALDAITQAPRDWDLVVTDFDMGDSTGVDLARKMHGQREDLPIILMTGNSELHFATKSVQDEFVATLRKPISASVLISVLLAAKLRSQRHI
ncbi:PAS domain-containing protein [Roseibaca sp. Y0-43]|uniref:PAS domain-containing protein n=1 Tax=Roseibaca sp. Y0-43 TaxID=2816854 RepID=UPI001D0C93F7|nr:PAS domain-containing protein [Roseibaca sp. Y0-43]MCC1480249.1 PAS domain S-box protein [Roseibaca sp. Y0-43]